MRYCAYAALARAKRAIGMNAHRHRNYLIWKLVKLLDSGKVDLTKLSVTSMGKSDGVGAQALAKISAMCLAKAYGLTYVHVPFEKLAHAEFSPELWTEKWEQLLNMGHGHPELNPETTRVVGLGEYVENPILWNQQVVLADRQFHAFCKLAPIHGSEVAKELQPAFDNPAQPSTNEPDFVIGVHIRRGDVNANDPNTKHRFTKSSHTISILEQAIQAAKKAGHHPSIQLHSNGSKDELTEFSKFPDIEYFAGCSAMETFTSLAKSDILITTRSDFSVLAGFYCKGIVISDPRHRAPLLEWIKTSGAKTNIEGEVSHRLNSPNHSTLKEAD